jgi:hypothetical protein
MVVGALYGSERTTCGFRGGRSTRFRVECEKRPGAKVNSDRDVPQWPMAFHFGAQQKTEYLI